LCCGFDSTLLIILIGNWKHHFELKKKLQLEVTFSTSKCSWNVIETIVENLGFSPSEINGDINGFLLYNGSVFGNLNAI